MSENLENILNGFKLILSNSNMGVGTQLTNLTNPNVELKTYYDIDNDRIKLNNNYINDYIDGITNILGEFNSVKGIIQGLALTDSSPVLQDAVARIKTQEEFINNNQHLTETVKFTENERELLRYYIIAHELGHAVFYKHDQDGFDPNLFGGNFTDDEIKNINSALSFIDITNITKDNPNKITGSLHSSIKDEIQADITSVFLMYKMFPDKQEELNNFFDKIREARYKHNYLNSVIGLSSHNSELAFTKENIGRVKELLSNNGNTFEKMDDLADSIYLDTLKKYGINIKQENLSDMEISQNKDGVQNLVGREFNDYIEGLKNENIDDKNKLGLLSSLANQDEQSFNEHNSQQQRYLNKKNISEDFESFTKLFDINVLINNGNIQKDLSTGEVENISKQNIPKYN